MYFCKKAIKCYKNLQVEDYDNVILGDFAPERGLTKT